MYLSVLHHADRVCYNPQLVGAWRSLVAHLHGVQGVASSNPAAPTIRINNLDQPSDWSFLF